jgi:hypothetical protein
VFFGHWIVIDAAPNPKATHRKNSGRLNRYPSQEHCTARGAIVMNGAKSATIQQKSLANTPQLLRVGV